MAITDWPVDERPREKLLAKGADALSDAELLAIFLRTGIRGKSAVDLARDLLTGSGSLSALTQSPKSHARGEFAPNTVRLTYCRADDIFAGSQKKRLNFLFGRLQADSARAGAQGRIIPPPLNLRLTNVHAFPCAALGCRARGPGGNTMHCERSVGSGPG